MSMCILDSPIQSGDLYALVLEAKSSDNIVYSKIGDMNWE